MLKQIARIGSIMLVAVGVSVPVAIAGHHPQLVSVQASKCTNCHGDLLRGMVSVHPPAKEDCTNCHDVQITATSTTIGLNEKEPALCLECHDGLQKAVDGKLASPHPPVGDSCLNCHSPHASANKHLLNEAIPALCLACHDLDELQPKHGGQLTEDVNCLACHSPHGSDAPNMLRAKHQHPPFGAGECDACHRKPFAGRVRLRAFGAKVCTACHGEIINPKAVSIHPALDRRRNRKVCVACHDPHMSDNPSLLIVTGPDLCKKCHPGIVKAARADTGHPAASEDCTNCHKPHDASQPNLLTEATPALCLECHDADDAQLRKAHLGADMTTLPCVSCHTPHGDGNKYLLAKTVHPPVLDGCDTCHEGAYNKLMDDGGSALCLECHDDIGEEAKKAKFPHPAMEMAECTDCHNPHASAQDHLVKEPSGKECLACHDDIGPGKNEVAHGVITLIGCRVCHEPHGGSRPHLLRMDPDALCLSCHDAKHSPPPNSTKPVKVLGQFEIPAEIARVMASLRLSPDGTRDHPVTNHRVLGTPSKKELKRNDAHFKGELHCLTCHNPHKGASRLLLRWGAANSYQACAHCHPK
ncbi:MAG: hypothetical protein GXP48_02135 [Acidobacteria bacterium]|nr:hypothetical protein [Acidobacteriota bacterium]